MKTIQFTMQNYDELVNLCRNLKTSVPHSWDEMDALKNLVIERSKKAIASQNLEEVNLHLLYTKQFNALYRITLEARKHRESAFKAKADELKKLIGTF